MFLFWASIVSILYMGAGSYVPVLGINSFYSIHGAGSYVPVLGINSFYSIHRGGVVCSCSGDQ